MIMREPSASCSRRRRRINVAVVARQIGNADALALYHYFLNPLVLTQSVV